MKIIMAVVTLCLLVSFFVTHPAFAENAPKPMFSNEITERDKKGRAKITQIKTVYGFCMSEAVYDRKLPEIHMVIFKDAHMPRHLGFIIIRNTTEETITDEHLMEQFDNAADACLSHLLPGYGKT